jgi:eukaryotic-like serine/threonine-protein kinase
LTSPDPGNVAADTSAGGLAESILERIGRHSGLPGLGLTAARVVQLSASDSSRGDLVNLVLTDASLTQRTLRLANSVLYRRDTEPITTVSRALLMIGYEQVKMLALSQALLDQMQDKAQSAVLRAELSQAVYASMLAKRHFGGHLQIAEEAAVCAMLRGIGRMMTAAYAYDAYAAATTRAAREGVSENRAMADLTGHSFDAIGQRILADWGMPDRILQGCAGIPGVVTVPKSPDDRLRAGTEFCVRLAEAARDPLPERREGRIAKVVERFGHALGVDRRSVEELMADTAEVTREMHDILGLGPHAGPPASPVAPTSSGRSDEPAAADELSGNRPSGDTSAPPAAPSPAPNPATVDSAEQPPLRGSDGAQSRAILLAGIGEMSAAIASTCELADVLRIAVESLFRAFSCRRAVLSLHEPGGGGFRAALWIGDFDAERARQFRFSTTGQTHLFAVSLQRNADIHIRDAADPKIAATLPESMRRACADAGSFFLLPLVVRERAVGLLYADRPAQNESPVDAEDLALLRALKGQALLALRLGNP